MKINVCAFASHHMAKGAPRFIEQARDMEIFDQITTLNQNDLDKDFKKLWGRYLVKYSRGYGYWCWKPYLILKELDKMDDGDILLYIDLGCFFNPRGRDKLQEYINRTLQSDKGILALRSDENNTNGLPETLNYENYWTKGDIFEHFGVLDDENITHSTQYEATLMFIKKNEFSVNFVKEWYQVFLDNFSLATDAPSKIPNFPEFIDNRHDQSIFSILAKKHNIEWFSTSEVFQRNWSLLSAYPIWAMRDKAYPSKIHYRLRFKIRKLYVYLWKVKYFFKDIFCGINDRNIIAK